ncbi:MAG TPA: carboxypeptidase-like regulatory domain-containing protein [Gemmatimonadales bacterium]|nr:carboxypeptidase-like regulatory domain-containing protein [Gemmatimonadales bacterium]
MAPPTPPAAPRPSRTVLRALLLAAVALLCAAGARAQAPASAPGMVRGTVFDSLLFLPVRDARVWVTGGEREARTDAAGAFTLRGVAPGAHIVSAAHPALDSIGLGTLAAVVHVPAGGEARVTLGTPSFDRLWRAACGDSLSNVPGTGLLFGVVRDAESDEPVPGATVLAAWLTLGEGGSRGVEAQWPSLVAPTDGAGTYYACGVEVDRPVAAVAYGARGASGEMETRLGPRRIARLDLAVSQDSLAPTDTVLAKGGEALRRGRAVLRGVVRDERGRPVEDVLVTVAGAAAQAHTDSAGAFVLAGLPGGSQFVEARRVGYGAARAPVTLRVDAPARVELALSKTTVLSDVVVKVPRGARRLVELDRRRAIGFGRFIDGEEIARLPQLRIALASDPTLTVEDGRGENVGQFFVMGRPTVGRAGARGMSGPASCMASVYIDGFLDRGQAMLQSLDPDEVIAIEVYDRATTAPPQYVNGFGGCSVVLIWTSHMQ